MDFLDKIEELEGVNQIPINDLFNEIFMEKYTRFSSIDEFFETTEWEVEDKEDLEEIPEQELDTFVRDKTKFSSWEHMLNQAGKEWFKRQLED